MNPILIGLIVIFILFAIGSPIAMALAISAAIMSLWAHGFPLPSIAQFMVTSIDSYILLAVPLFVYMGYMLLDGGSARPLTDLMRATLGHLPGGAGVATIAACAIFAALTGVTLSVFATIGIIMIPVMLSMKYDRGVACSVMCAAGPLGDMIPPSVVLILYGSLESLNISTLFAGGVIPGIMIALMLSFTIYIIAKRRHYPSPPSVSWKERKRLFIKAIPVLLAPGIVLGGIYGGVFTPTEAAGVGCIYSILIGFVVYRGLNLKTFWRGTGAAMRMIGEIGLLVVGGIFFGRMIVLTGLPETICSWVTTAQVSPIFFLFLVLLIDMILGTFLEVMCVLYIVIPVFFPALMTLGISPVQFGVIVVLGWLIGGSTPPMAESIYVMSKVGNTPMREIVREIWPFLITAILAGVILVLFPQICTFLPELMGLPGVYR